MPIVIGLSQSCRRQPTQRSLDPAFHVTVAASSSQQQPARSDQAQCAGRCQVFQLVFLSRSAEVAAGAVEDFAREIGAQPGGATACAGRAGDVPAVIRDADFQFIGVAGMGSWPAAGARRWACSTVHFLFDSVNIISMVYILA